MSTCKTKRSGDRNKTGLRKTGCKVGRWIQIVYVTEAQVAEDEMGGPYSTNGGEEE
jgi:hypothetical protein